MGLFDFFKKKNENPPQSQSKFIPENKLEEVLMKAAKEASYRAEFYRQLMDSELIVITDGRSGKEGTHTLEKNTTVNIVTSKDGKMPVFSSTKRIFDKGIIKEQVNFMGMNAKSLFELTKGTTLFLNPYSDYGKELLPHEIDQLLDGSIFEHAKTITVQKETKVQIGQPADYPTELVNSLKQLYSRLTDVNAAYLGWIFDPNSGQPPHYIIGIDAKNDFQNICRDSGVTSKYFLKQDEIIDFVQIDNESGISDYLSKRTKAFYRK